MPERVYISAVPADKPWADRLAYDLYAAGIAVELPAPELDMPGQTTSDLAAHIYDHLAKCDAFLLILSPEALASYRVNREMYQATTRALNGEMQRPLLIAARPFAPRQLPGEWAQYLVPGVPIGDYWRAAQAVTAAWTTEAATPDLSGKPVGPTSWRPTVFGHRGDSADGIMVLGLGLIAIGFFTIFGFIIIGIVVFIVGLALAIAGWDRRPRA